MTFFSYSHINISVYIISIIYYSLFLANQGYCSELESEERWADPPGFVHPVWNSWTQLPPCTSHTLHSNVWSHEAMCHSSKGVEKGKKVTKASPKLAEVAKRKSWAWRCTLEPVVCQQKTGRHFRKSLLLFQGKMSVPSVTNIGQPLDEKDHVCFSGNQK